jgi:hypothetical protein
VLARRAPLLEDTVKFKAIAVIAAASALSLGMAGSAAASSVSHKAKPAPQVTGTRLQSALLPASVFGSGFTVTGPLNTGKKLWSTRALGTPQTLSCAKFEEYIYVGGFGNTAGATAYINNPNPAFADYPSVVLGGDQTVIQFKTAAAATSFYNRAWAKYKQCSYFTESFPGDSQFELTNESLSTTTFKKNKAFQLIQYLDITSLPALNFYLNTTVVLSGTNVYTIDESDGTNDAVPTSLVGSLMTRVQAAYKK